MNKLLLSLIDIKNDRGTINFERLYFLTYSNHHRFFYSNSKSILFVNIDLFKLVERIDSKRSLRLNDKRHNQDDLIFKLLKLPSS